MAQVGLYVDDAQRDRWRRAAFDAGVTLSEWVRQQCDHGASNALLPSERRAREALILARRFLAELAALDAPTQQGGSAPGSEPPRTIAGPSEQAPAAPPSGGQRPHWQNADGSVREPTDQELSVIKILGTNDAMRVLELPPHVIARWSVEPPERPTS